MSESFKRVFNFLPR